ncbi:unnamed protein product [Arabidopsis halleri]
MAFDDCGSVYLAFEIDAAGFDFLLQVLVSNFQVLVSKFAIASFWDSLIYQHQHNKQMSCPTMAQLLSNTLYFKRFSPYYAFNVLGGLDEEGKGCVFTYDAVGSNESVGYGAQGSGSTLIMPFLDNQLKSPSPLLLPKQGPNVNTSPSNCTLMCLDSLRKQELKSKGFEESLALAVSMNDTFGSVFLPL